MNEDAARRALGTLNDEPAPPVSTTLDEVFRRGRRRVLGQRVASVAGVMAVVAAIGAGAVLLRPGDGPDGVQVAGTTTTAPPSDKVAVLPGWQLVELPELNTDGTSCQPRHDSGLPQPADVSLLSQNRVSTAFTGAVGTVTGDAPTITMVSWEGYSEKAMGPHGYVAVEIGMGDGNGQLQLEVDRYGGTPTQAADASVVAYGNCDRPMRRVLADGTVLQLYPADRSDPLQPHQPLAIYTPGGHQYIVTAAGYGQEDVSAAGGASTSGRGRLPTDDTQLAAVALELVAKLH